jgi:hypothetical protein
MGNGTYLSFLEAERRCSVVSCTRRAANICRLRWTFSSLLRSYSVIGSIVVAAVLCGNRYLNLDVLTTRMHLERKICAY